MADQNGLVSSDGSLASWFAALLGIVLILIGLGGFLYLRSSPVTADSIAIHALDGLILLSLSLAGLIVVAKALGISTPDSALGLPSGSVRALLAFGLVIVFVAIASWSLANPPGANANPQVFDLQKQIMTTVATVLVTVVGFYFGSKSASDATASANQTIANVQKVLAGGSTEAPAPVSFADLQGKQSQIRGLANGVKSKLGSLGTDPLSPLREAAKKLPDATKIGDAETAFAGLGKQAAATATDADRADAAIGALGAGETDQGKLQPVNDRLQQLLDDANTANKDFGDALTAFNNAKTAILASTASG